MDVATAQNPTLLEDMDAVAAAAAALVTAARREVLIVSDDLQPRLYDQQAFLDAVRAFCLSSRRARLRVLVRDVDRSVRNGHRLVELARRLSSFIEIRRLAEQDAAAAQQGALVGDRRAVMRQPTPDSRLAELWSDAPMRGREAAEQFDELWARAQPDPDLRRLHL